MTTATLIISIAALILSSIALGITPAYAGKTEVLLRQRLTLCVVCLLCEGFPCRHLPIQ